MSQHLHFKSNTSVIQQVYQINCQQQSYLSITGTSHDRKPSHSIGNLFLGTRSRSNSLINTPNASTNCRKNTKIRTAHTIVSWPNPKQRVIVHTSDSMMIIRQSTYVLSIITREMGQLKTHSPTCFVMDNWGNMPYLTHTLDKLYLTGILWVQCLQISLHNDDNGMV